MDAKLRIKQLMEERGISEYKLAKMSDLSQSTISNIFVRNTAPTVPTLEAICKGLGISLSQFFADASAENAVYLTDEQQQLFRDWVFLTEEQKDVVKKLIDSYKNK